MRSSDSALFDRTIVAVGFRSRTDAITASTCSGSATSEIALFVKEPERFTGRKMVRDMVVAILGFGHATWAMYATGSEAIAKGYILLMLGIPIYLYLRWRHQRDRTPLRTEPYELPELPKQAPATLERLFR